MDIIFQKKRELRDRIEKKRRRLSKEWVKSKSDIILGNLRNLPEFQSAQIVHCYVAWRNEVNTHSLIRELLQSGRRVVVPVVDLSTHALQHSEIKKFEDLQVGTFGILEPPKEFVLPVTLSDLDLIIVPGIGFDLQGRRIGFGGGYYDDFLKRVKATKVGLCYHFQIVDKIPTRNQDERVDIIITEYGVYRIGKH